MVRFYFVFISINPRKGKMILELDEVGKIQMKSEEISEKSERKKKGNHYEKSKETQSLYSV